MKFTNEFSIPLGIDKAFEVLTDLERVAPCMPGATLNEVEGDTYSGQVKIRVGPMHLTYAGTATLSDRNPTGHSARVEALGRERRGSSTASADVLAELHDEDGETVVVVTTDIDVTGKPAQFGRGMMADVGARVIGRFAENLETMLTSGDVEYPPSATHAADEGSSGGSHVVERRPPHDDALDVMGFVGPTVWRAVVVLVTAGLAALVWRRGWRRSGSQEPGPSLARRFRGARGSD